jgi:putative transcriptional regulator
MRFMQRVVMIAAALLAPAALLAATSAQDQPPLRETPSLAGQLLIAAPEMRDPRFAHTVLVLVRHSREGAVGLVINRPLGEQPLSRLLKAIGESDEGAAGSVMVYYGGPVQLELGFILHSADYHRTATLQVTKDVGLTASPEIFRDIAAGQGPKKALVAFGYAGWGPGQLEGEMARNGWFIAPADPKLVFDEPRDRVWDLAMQHRTRDL